MTALLNGLLALAAIAILVFIVLADAFTRRRDDIDDHRFD